MGTFANLTVDPNSKLLSIDLSRNITALLPIKIIKLRNKVGCCPVLFGPVRSMLALRDVLKTGWLVF
jgi:hypothetical protein